MLSVASTAKAIVAIRVFTSVLLVTSCAALAPRSLETTRAKPVLFREGDLMPCHRVITTRAAPRLAERRRRRAGNYRWARQFRAGRGNTAEGTFDKLRCAGAIE